MEGAELVNLGAAVDALTLQRIRFRIRLKHRTPATGTSTGADWVMIIATHVAIQFQNNTQPMINKTSKANALSSGPPHSGQ